MKTIPFVLLLPHIPFFLLLLAGCALKLSETGNHGSEVEKAQVLTPPQPAEQQQQEMEKNKTVLERQRQEIQLLKKRLGEY